jgi:AraC-like DNA-binding protein
MGRYSSIAVLRKKKPVMTEEYLRAHLPGQWLDRDFAMQEDRRVKLITAKDITNFLPRHVHDKLYIGVIDEGERNMRYRGASHRMGCGNIFLINMDEPHECDDDMHSFRVVGFDEKTVMNVAREIDVGVKQMSAVFDKLIANDRFLFHEISSLFHLMDASAVRLAIETKINGILSRLLFRHMAGCADLVIKANRFSASVRFAKEYIRGNYCEDISLDKLAAITGLTPFHLARIFTSTYGLPPHQYLMRVRVDAAKRALLSSRAVISDVGIEVGFYDHSHFNKMFKRYTGLTPLQYIRQQRPKGCWPPIGAKEGIICSNV